MSNKKYKLISKNNIKVGKHKLYRIKALKDFNDVKKGDIGGYVEKESNLSHQDNCWVYDDAKVYNHARVYDDAKIYENASVYGYADVCGNAEVGGNSLVHGHSKVCKTSKIFGEAEVTRCSILSGDNIEVFDLALITDSAIILDNTTVCGYTKVLGRCVLKNAVVSNNGDILYIDGLEKGIIGLTIYTISPDGNDTHDSIGVSIRDTDNFTLTEFEEYVYNDCNTPEYLTLLELIKAHFADRINENETKLKVVDIQWDIDDDSDDKITLPTEIEIPSNISADQIGDYISDITGFCHKGYNIKLGGN